MFSSLLLYLELHTRCWWQSTERTAAHPAAAELSGGSGDKEVNEHQAHFVLYIWHVHHRDKLAFCSIVSTVSKENGWSGTWTLPAEAAHWWGTGQTFGAGPSAAWTETQRPEPSDTLLTPVCAHKDTDTLQCIPNNLSYEVNYAALIKS